MTKLAPSKRLVNFFKRPVIEDAPLTFRSSNLSNSFSSDAVQPMRKEDRKFNEQMEVARIQNAELRQANQHNLNMLWRSQVLTTIMVLISFLGTLAATVGVIVASQQRPPTINIEDYTKTYESSR